jgi:hypothetical protein
MKLSKFVLLIAPLVIAGIVYSVHSQTQPKQLRSFVVTSVMSSPKDGSPYLVTSTFARAVRADGSWVEIWPGIRGENYHDERDIHDYDAHVYTIVEDSTQSVVREVIPQDEYKHRLSAATTCDGSSSGKILGLNVNYFEDTYQLTGHPQGPATAVVKDWLVPDLGCFVLQKETIWTRNSDGLLLSDTKITPIAVSFQSVNQFFEIPTTYTERTKQETLELVKQLHATSSGVVPGDLLKGINASRAVTK